MTWLIAIAALAQGYAITGLDALNVVLPLALALALLWRVREFLPSHADMLILMAALGGLGMLVPMLAGAPACHLDGHRAGMYFGMLALPAWPCWTRARCVLQARREGWAAWLLAGDLVGMSLGMELGSLLGRGHLWGHHALMLAGMLLGMAASMALAGLIRRATVKTDSRGQAIAGRAA